jgi:hypothetical protein
MPVRVTCLLTGHLHTKEVESLHVTDTVRNILNILLDASGRRKLLIAFVLNVFDELVQINLTVTELMLNLLALVCRFVKICALEFHIVLGLLDKRCGLLGSLHDSFCRLGNVSKINVF